MERIYKASIISGIVFIIILYLYILTIPRGQVYSNAVFLNIGKSQTNIDSYGSYVINISENETIYFFSTYKTLFSSNNNKPDIILTPINSSFYNMEIGNKSFLIPETNNNLILSYFNGTLEFFSYNKSLGFAYLINITSPPLKSVYSTKNITLKIFYNNLLESHPITIGYVPTNASYYQNITIYCKSDTHFILLKTNYGTDILSNDSKASVKTKAYPNLEVDCYNGYNYISKNFTFLPLSPKLNYVYRNKIFTCHSSFPSIVYLIFNNKILSAGIQNVSYNMSNIKPPFSVTCESAGNLYQKETNITVNITS